MIRVTPESIGVANGLVQRDFPGVDLSQFVANKMNYCLVKDDSGAMFAWRGPHIYEVHVFLGVRGKEALAIMHDFLAWMRLHCDARFFWAAIPIESRKVAMFARLMGWKYRQQGELPEGQVSIFSTE